MTSPTCVFLSHFRIVLLCVLAHFLQTVVSEARRCASCNMEHFEEYKQIKQQQILDDLLRKLDLPSKPNVTVDYDNLPLEIYSPRIKRLVEHELRRRENKRRVRKHSQTTEFSQEYFPSLYETDAEETPQITYIMGKKPPSFLDEGIDVVFFNFPSNMQSKSVIKAALHAFVRRPAGLRHLQKVSVRIDVFERFANGTMGDKVATKYEHISGSVSETLVQIPLDELDVQRWMENRAGSEQYPMGLYAEAMHDGENLVYQPHGHFKQPMYLEVELMGSSGRSKRSAPQVCQVDDNESKCCLYDLEIDFEEVGWEFVIAPKKFNAYICNGDCTATQSSQTARGKLTQQAKVDYFQCCHPKDYTGIRIAFMTDPNVVSEREVPGMVARKCGCT